jgi:hypothetical protein
MSTNSKPKIIYIAGAGHSGSTLLDLLLSTSPNTFSVGELKHLDHFLTDTSKAYADDTGAAASQSAFWSYFHDQKEQYLPKWRVERVLSMRNKLALLLTGRPRTIPQRYKNNDRLYTDILAQIRNISANPEIDTIIDSSKVTSRLIEINERVQDFDVYVIHLVRDVRGVAYSYYKDQRSVLKWSFGWLSTNWGIARYAKKRIPKERYIFLRYEEFATEPTKTIQRLNHALGLSVDTETYVDQINQQTSYRFGGNGMREKKFEGIVFQESWRQALPRYMQIALRPLQWLCNTKLK